jgi:iron complex outermembrane receptor protein
MNYELGAEYQLASELTFALSAYHMDMRDEIAYDPVTWEQVNMNKTRRQGVDAELAWTRRDVAGAALQYGCARAKLRSGNDSGNDVPLAPRHVVTLRGEASCKTDFALLAALRAVGGQFMGSDFANTADKLNGYATLDLGLRYRPSQVKGLQLLLSCDNVLDKTHANMGYFVDMAGWGSDIYGYYPANGRTWRFAASYNF